jgi:hypothetical protein
MRTSVAVTEFLFAHEHAAATQRWYAGMLSPFVAFCDEQGIAPKEEFADRMGLEELAANLFVRTQTEAKVRNEEIEGSEAIVGAHYEVGAETRTVIERIGGTMPEELPDEPTIRLMLDPRTRHSKKQLPRQDGPTLFDTLPPADEDNAK